MIQLLLLLCGISFADGISGFVPMTTMPASNITGGMLSSEVIASSISASGMGGTATLGSPSLIPQITITSDGRIVSGSNQSIISNNIIFGVYVSTTAAGGAGSGVTAPCSNGSVTAKAVGGGCSCSGVATLSTYISRPDSSGSPPAGGSMPTGWFCQMTGLTGGSCSAYAICLNTLQ